ncbi:MAG: aminotransferase class V-fold PLP-dependent enzyme, partial [Mesorhizobium sp.]
EEIIIGANMTTLTYHMSRTLGRTMKPGDEIILTRMDHEGNVSPWLQLAEDLGLVARFLPFDEKSWQLEEAALRALLSEKTRLVALNYASNLTGSINRVKALTAIAKQAGALVYVDAVQFAPHGLIDVQDLG